MPAIGRGNKAFIPVNAVPANSRQMHGACSIKINKSPVISGYLSFRHLAGKPDSLPAIRRCFVGKPLVLGVSPYKSKREHLTSGGLSAYDSARHRVCGGHRLTLTENMPSVLPEIEGVRYLATNQSYPDGNRMWISGLFVL